MWMGLVNKGLNEWDVTHKKKKKKEIDLTYGVLSPSSS
jgi:hypothetical protein